MTGVSDNKKINYRVMGQDNFPVFLSIPKHLLEAHGIYIRLIDVLETTKEYNPCFPFDEN